MYGNYVAHVALKLIFNFFLYISQTKKKKSSNKSVDTLLKDLVIENSK